MEAPCELRIIRVIWARKDQHTDVQAAQAPIPLEYDGQVWVAEVPAWPSVDGTTHGQLAVALPKGASAPCLLLGDDTPSPLKLIQAPDGRDWWIENGDWDRKKRYHDAPLCRHAGEARLRVGTHLIRLRIAPTGFTSNEFDRLLEEFRNGAWQLILYPLSPTQATDRRGDGGIDPAFLDAVAAFVRHAGRALDQPHRELREEPQLQRLERVRPTAGTFRELSARGAPRLVTGRGHAASFNTPENRRLLAMCSRLRRTLSGLLAGAKGAAADFQRRAQADDNRAEAMRQTIGVAKVDERKLARLIEEAESDLRYYAQAVHRLVAGYKDGTPSRSVEVRVTKEVNAEYGRIGFWSAVSAVDGAPRSDLRYRFNFDEDIGLLQAVFRKGIRYKIAGSFSIICNPSTNSLGDWGKAEVLRVHSIDSGFEHAVSEQISALNNFRARLACSDYKIALTNKKDMDDQRRDLAEAQRSAERLRVAAETICAVARLLAPLVGQLASLERRAGVLGIKLANRTGLTGSMTWVMNPDYRGALGAFRSALERAGLKASELDGLLRLQDLGILDLPMVYERWCLLRIVAVLRDYFHLTPPGDLRERLLGSVTSRGKVRNTLSLRFEGQAIQRDVVLEYQPRLVREGRPRTEWPNPDFMLTVLPRDGKGAAGANPHPRMVLDAKCKRFAALGETGGGLSLVEELDDLLGQNRKKRYHEPGDHRVFVLHPGPSPAAAERAEDYGHLGGSYMVPEVEKRKPWDQAPPDHRYGAVLVRPGLGDPLIRLILMHLYLGLDDSCDVYTKRSPEWPLICPACGGTEMTHEPPPGTWTTHHPGRARWCVGCGQMLVWNFSGGCGTHLYKLGGHWTFHDTHPLNPYNIRCPHCGDFMSIPEVAPEPDKFDETYEWGEPSWPP